MHHPVTAPLPDLGDAMLHSWAAVLDVLAFYQDRIATESYLTTAREEWSLRELAATLGYAPSPGTASTGHVAFVLSTNRGLQTPVVVPAGTSVRNAPLAGGQPQVFETSHDLHADPAFNAIPALVVPPDDPVKVEPKTRSLSLSGFPPIRPGDSLLISEPGRPMAAGSDADVRTVHSVTPDPAAKTTTVGISAAPPTSDGSHRRVVAPDVTKLRTLGALFGHDAVAWKLATPAAKATYGVPLGGPYVMAEPLGPIPPPATKQPADWRPARSGLGAQPVTCALVVGDEILVGTAGDGISSTRLDPDGMPAAWTSRNRGLTNKDVYALAAGPTGSASTSADRMFYAGTSRGGVWRSVDGGRQWEQIRGLATTTVESGTPKVTSTKLPNTTVRALLVLDHLPTTPQHPHGHGSPAGNQTDQPATAGEVVHDLEEDGAAVEDARRGDWPGAVADGVRLAEDVVRQDPAAAGTIRRVVEETEVSVGHALASVGRLLHRSDAPPAREVVGVLRSNVASLDGELLGLGGELDRIAVDLPTGSSDRDLLATLLRWHASVAKRFRDSLRSTDAALAALGSDASVALADLREVQAALIALDTELSTLATTLDPTPTETTAASPATQATPHRAVDRTRSATDTATTALLKLRRALLALETALASSKPVSAQTAASPVIFAGTDQGLWYATGVDSGWQNVKVVGSTVVFDLARDGDEVVVAHAGGIVALSYKGSEFTPGASWSDGAATALTHHDSTWYAATARGVLSWSGGTSKWSPTAVTTPAQAIVGLANGVLAATSDGLQWLADGTTEWVAVNSSATWPGVENASHTEPTPVEAMTRQVTALVAIDDAARAILVSGASGDANIDNWPDWSVTGGCPGSSCVDLANPKAESAPGDKVILVQTGKPARVLEVEHAEVVSRTAYGTTARVKRLTVQPADGLDDYDLREAKVVSPQSGVATPLPPPTGAPIPVTQPSVPTYGQSSSARPMAAAVPPSVLHHGDALGDHSALVDLQPASAARASHHGAPVTPTAYVRGSSIVLDGATPIPPDRLVAITGIRCRIMFDPPGGVTQIDPSAASSDRRLEDWTVGAIVAVDPISSGGPILVAATDEGPVLISAASTGKRSRWRSAGFPDGDTSYVTALSVSANHTVLVGTHHGRLYRWSPPSDPENDHESVAAPTGTWAPLATTPENVPITAIEETGSIILIGTDFGVWRIDEATESVSTVKVAAQVTDDRLNGRIRSFTTVGRAVLAATSDGVWARRDDAGGWDRFGTGLDHRDVVGIVERQGRYYAATGTGDDQAVGDVLVAGEDRTWRPTGWAESDLCAVPTCLVATTDGSIVVGTSDDGLRILAGGADRWARLDGAGSSSVRSLCAGTSRLFAGTARVVVARDSRGCAHRIEASPVGRVKDPTTNDIQQLDGGVLPPSITSALAAAEVKLPKHYNVTITLEGLQWEVDDIATPLVVTATEGHLRLELRPTPRSLVAETRSTSHQSDWTIDLGASGTATVRAPTQAVKLLTGVSTDSPTAEINRVVDSTARAGGTSTMHLAEPLRTWYDASTVTVSANVVEATQGETIAGEVLGNGDASTTFQRFPLRKPPLTYVPSAAPSGSSPSLTIFVGQRSPALPTSVGPPAGTAAVWKRVDTLMVATAHEHTYMIREVVGDDDVVRTEVLFGDGANGARLPTGASNVTAKYRVGVGGPTLDAGSLSVLGSRPVGVRRVLNPVATVAGESPAGFGDLRRAVPEWSLATDRIVSLDDYGHFARRFAGVGECDVNTVYNGRRVSIDVTVGGRDGRPFPDDTVTSRLAQAVSASRVGDFPVEVNTYEMRWFALTTTVRADPSVDADRLVGAITAELDTAFGPTARAVGASLELLDVQIVLESVAGVIGVTTEEFYVLGCHASCRRRIDGTRARYDPVTRRVLPATKVAVSLPDLDVKVDRS